MTTVDKQLKPYLEEAKRWDQDRLRDLARSRRFAWIVAGVASLLATASVAAVATLAPLKTVEPYVIRVNEATGAVDVMTALRGTKPVSYDEAVTKNFLAQYVRAREGFLRPALNENFRLVSLFSTPEEQGRWSAYFRGSNPQSPQNLYGPNDTATITIRGISFVNDKVANVRFRKDEVIATIPKTADYIATITYSYTRAPIAEADRLVNPLGFQVTNYRVDPEVTP